MNLLARELSSTTNCLSETQNSSNGTRPWRLSSFIQRAEPCVPRLTWGASTATGPSQRGRGGLQRWGHSPQRSSATRYVRCSTSSVCVRAGSSRGRPWRRWGGPAVVCRTWSRLGRRYAGGTEPWPIGKGANPVWILRFYCGSQLFFSVFWGVSVQLRLNLHAAVKHGKCRWNKNAGRRPLSKRSKGRSRVKSCHSIVRSHRQKWHGGNTNTLQDLHLPLCCPTLTGQESLQGGMEAVGRGHAHPLPETQQEGGRHRHLLPQRRWALRKRRPTSCCWTAVADPVHPSKKTGLLCTIALDSLSRLFQTTKTERRLMEREEFWPTPSCPEQASAGTCTLTQRKTGPSMPPVVQHSAQ